MWAASRSASAGSTPERRIVFGQRIGIVREIQQFDLRHQFESLPGHCRIAAGNFIENDLRGEKLLLLAFQIPPVAGELLPAACKRSRAGRATT
jgi:hypothetical protein